VSLNPCQPGPNASCGACCGLYAFNADRPSIDSRLRSRTAALSGQAGEAFREAAGALAVERRTSEALGGAVAHCALAGFLDPDGRRVGCLGHPTVTGGSDLRDLGSFGAHTCEAFQCPSVGEATDEEIALARDGCDDWCLYGRVITDLVFLRACLGAVKSAVGRAPCLRDLESTGVRAALGRLLSLKAGQPPFGAGPERAWPLGSLAEGVALAIAASSR
jgi:hypothetical protein